MTPDRTPSPYWKRNLAVSWVAQVVAVVGWTVTFPFYPFFFESVGVADPAVAAFWTGVSGWVFGLGLFFAGPLWGALADRRGRKLNVLRAFFLGGLSLLPAGYATAIWHVVVSRLVIGAAHGLDWAVNGLMAAVVPRASQAFAFGVLQTSLFAGSMIGPLVGGVFIDRYGMKVAFLASGAAFLLPGFLVLALVRERFERPHASARNPVREIAAVAVAREMRPLWVLLIGLHGTFLMGLPVLPPLMSELHTGPNDGTATGFAFMAHSTTSIVSALFMSWLGTRVGLRRVFVAGVFVAAGGWVLLIAARTDIELVLAMGVLGLLQGGLISSLNGLLAQAAPAGKEGLVFGAAQAAIAVAVGMGPLIGGTLALWVGLRGVFVVMIASLTLVGVAAAVMLPRPGATTRRVGSGEDAPVADAPAGR